MNIFHQLSATPGQAAPHEQFVDYPLGIITVPYNYDNTKIRGQFKENEELSKALVAQVYQIPHFRDNYRESSFPMSPLLVFLYLDDWVTTKPTEIETRESYFQQLQNAIAFLNLAQVDHLDLRPANIMWRLEGNEFRLKICDFENAVIFGTQISSQLLTQMAGDYRYPFTSPYNDEPVQYGCARNNFYFRHCIRRWLDSEVNEFGKFVSIAMTHTTPAENLVQNFFSRYPDPRDSDDHGL